MTEIAQVLRRTKGAITWQQLTSSICGVGIPLVGVMTVARYVMNLPGSEYTTTRILPLLNTSTKLKITIR